MAAAAVAEDKQISPSIPGGLMLYYKHKDVCHSAVLAIK